MSNDHDRGQDAPSFAETSQELEDSDMLSLLGEYNRQNAEPVDTNAAFAAIKLARYANLFYPKKYFSRLRHTVAGPSDAEYERLFGEDADDLINDAKSHPEKYDRSILLKVATHHFMRANHVDVQAYDRGMKKHGRWEGVHSALGRTAVFGLSSAGVLINLGAQKGSRQLAAKGNHDGATHLARFGKAAKFLLLWSGQNVVSPPITGIWRIKTNARQDLLRDGGAPNLAKNIASFKHLDENYPAMHAADQSLGALLNELRDQLRDNGRTSEDLLQRIQQGFSEAADAENKIDLTVAGNEQQTISKEYGAYSNVWAGIGQTLTTVGGAISDEKTSYAVTGAGLTIQATSIFTQWAAGTGDKGPAHPYAVKLNVDLGDFWKKEAAEIPFEERNVSHIDPAAVRATWTSLEQQKIKNIQEIYKHRLGEIQRQIRQIETSDDQPAIEDETLATLRRDFQNLLDEVGKFESFTEDSWKSLNRNSVIGKCLNDPETFRLELEEARLKKPGEKAAQISQRYYHALHTILLSPAVSALVAQIINLTDVEEAKKIIISAVFKGVGDGLHLPFMTGEVRVMKADNKDPLAAILDAARQTVTDEMTLGAWSPTTTAVLSTGERITIPIDLTTGAGFDNFVHDYWQQWGRVFSIAPQNLASGVKALYYSSRAFPARNSARKTAQEILALLRTAPNIERPFLDEGEAKRQATLMAAYDEVRTYGETAVREKQSAVERRAQLPQNLHAATPKQWVGMPAADKDPFAVNVRPQQTTNADPEDGQSPALVLKDGEHRSEQERTTNLWEASFQEYVDTEKAPDINIDRDALVRAFVMLGSVHPDDKLIIPEIARGLGIDHDVAKNRDFWNGAKSLVLDYLPTAMLLPTLGLQHAAVAKDQSKYLNAAYFTANFVIQLGLIPLLRKRIQSYDNERAAIQSAGGVPNFNAIHDESLSPSSVRDQATAATAALHAARGDADDEEIDTTTANNAFRQAAAAKKAIKKQKVIEDIENTSTMAQDICNWVVNVTYALTPFAGQYTKNSRNAFYAQLGVNLVTGLYAFVTAGQKSASANTKKMKAVVEFFECRTTEAIKNNIEPMMVDETTGRAVPNPAFRSEHIDPVKVRQMWIGYCQLRLGSVERQINGRIDNIDARIADIHGVTLAEWRMHERYQSMKCGNPAGYGDARTRRAEQDRESYDSTAHKEAEINAREPLDDVADARLRTLEALVESNAMSVQMWEERRTLRNADLSGDPLAQARLRRLDILAIQSPAPDQWKELEILKIRKACTPHHDEDLRRSKEAAISRRVAQAGSRDAAEAQFNAEVQRARMTIGDDVNNDTDDFDQAVLDYAYGLPADKEAVRADIARRMNNVDDAQRDELTKLLGEKEQLAQQKIKLKNDWPGLNDDVKGLLDSALTGGLWKDAATAWNASSYERTNLSEKLANLYGNNNRFYSILGYGLPILADSSLLLWEAMINQHAPANCKDPLIQTGAALAYAFRTYQTVKAAQSSAASPPASIAKRKEDIEPPGTIIAGSDGVTIIGPSAAVNVNPSQTVIAGPGGTLSYPTAPPVTSTASAIAKGTTSSATPTIDTTSFSLPTTTLTSSPTPIPVPPDACAPSSGSVQHEDVPLAARIVRIVGVIFIAGYLGAENKGLKNAVAKYWRGVRSAETELNEADEALRKAIRANERAAASRKPPGDDEPPFEGSRQKGAEVGKEEIEKDNKALPDPTAKGDAASRRSLEIEEMTPATSSGLYTKVTEFLWGKNNAPVKPVEKVIQVGSRPQEYLVAIQQAVSGSRYSMPTLSSGEEIAEKGSIRLQWKYQGRDVTYWDDAPLTMTQTAKLELLNSLAKLLPTDGKPARDHFLMELKAEALKAWYEQHAAEETNIRIEQALPHEEKRSASEPATDDMSQSRDDYMAIERFLDEAIETDPEKKALAEFKFCLVYREFKRTQVEQGNADSGPEEFKQFLLCYLKGQQNILAETLRTPHENEIAAETLHSQITKLEKLERAMNVLTTDNREQVLPILEPNRHSDDAYRSFAAAERAAGGAPEDNNVDLADRFIDLYAQYNESALITSIEPFNEFLLRHYWRRAEQPNGESIKINLEAIQAVLTPDRSPSTDLPLADIQPFVVRRYDSGIGIDDDFESPLPPQSEHEAAHADAAAKAPDRLPRSDTFSSTDSAYFEDDDLEEALPQHLASEATIADKALQQDNAPIEGAQRTMSLTAWSAAFPEFHAQIMEGLRRIRPGAHVINTKVANLNDSSPELPLAGGRRVCVDEKTAAMAIYRPSDDTVYIAPKALSLQLMFNENKVISGWKAEPQNRKKTNQGPKRH